MSIILASKSPRRQELLKLLGLEFTVHTADIDEHMDPSLPPEQEVARLSGCELNELIARETNKTHIPRGLAELDEKPIRFTEVIEGSKRAIEAAVEDFVD